MNSNISFCETLKKENIETWNRILNHSFIIGISNNTIPIKRFIFYLNQDKIFLQSFRDLLNTASTAASNRETKILFEEIVDSTGQEMDMQIQILEAIEVDNTDIDQVPIQNITNDYMRYLTNVSHSEDLHLIVSALAPCPWTYFEISSSLSRNDIKSAVFKKWLQFYSSTESLGQVNQIKSLLDKLAMNVDEKKKLEMRHCFSLSCNYELQFWNMAYSD